MNLKCRIVWAALLLGCAATPPALAQSSPVDQMRRDFRNPPMSCRPHTRWWWMGNALSKADISWQLRQMYDHGIGGVEQITMSPVYERGNHPYLSPEYFDLIRHAVAESKRLGMEFSLNFGGPGWIWGGDWLPPDDRNQILLASFINLRGGQTFRGELPVEAALNPRDVERSLPKIRPEDRLLAVVVGQVVDGRLRQSSLMDLTAQVQGRRLTWKVPEGRWRLMAFWVAHCGGSALNLLNKAAVERYCDYLGGKFRAAIGAEFGKSVESLFGDSFEVPIFRNGIYWSPGLLAQFQAYKGYSLIRYLPAIWWEVDDISPKIRYDVNEFLDHVGFEAFFKTFLSWCKRNGVKGRVQPYGFVTDILQGAGMTDIPETEITAGEKDAVPWFDTRIGPRAYVTSGAHLYGRNIVSVEAYTYLHWEPGRATLEELKISGDTFLRSGTNKFYNAGFAGTPEREFVPSRRFGTAEVVISPVNVWWPYYPLLADYVARCSAVLRYGHPAADIAVYSPLANQWTLDALNARRWTRDFDWGDLGKLLLANGYDFDVLNDDVLLHHADLSHGEIRVRDLTYRILILPNIHAIPLESLKRIQEYVRNGGVVIALEQVPGASTGLADYRRRDAEVRALTSEMFRAPKGRDGTGAHRYGSGETYFIQKVIDRQDVLDRRSSVLDPFVNTLRRHEPPDFGIDFVRAGIRENNGLTFLHRKASGSDIYFVTNLQDRPVHMRIAFRVSGKAPQEWNPYNGEIRPLYEYDESAGKTILPVRLAPYESTIVVFAGNPNIPHILHSSFRKIVRVDKNGIEALAGRNGAHTVTLSGGPGSTTVVEGIPAPYEVAGRWRMVLNGKNFPLVEKTLTRLTSWTEDPATQHFSGTGEYNITFDLPTAYVSDDLVLQLSTGDVGNIADVELNGVHAGVIWMRGQSLDVTKAAKPGRNSLAIRVTNTLINRVSGYTRVPPLPPDLRSIYGKGIQDDSPYARGFLGFRPLPRSGLLGPVLIKPLKRVHISTDGTARGVRR